MLSCPHLLWFYSVCLQCFSTLSDAQAGQYCPPASWLEPIQWDCRQMNQSLLQLNHSAVWLKAGLVCHRKMWLKYSLRRIWTSRTWVRPRPLACWSRRRCPSKRPAAPPSWAAPWISSTGWCSAPSRPQSAPALLSCRSAVRNRWLHCQKHNLHHNLSIVELVSLVLPNWY